MIQSVLIRALKGIAGPLVASIFTYIIGHYVDFVHNLIKDPTAQTIIISFLSGIILAIEKAVNWKDKKV